MASQGRHSVPLCLRGFHVDNDPADAGRQWTVILYLSGDGSLGAHAEGATIFPDGWCRRLAEFCSVRKYLGASTSSSLGRKRGLRTKTEKGIHARLAFGISG
ncbi:unnamed protein product [Symbiodinium sp. CCMP2456]|nr:unnamed protein product [Symbiodinium sp. CCMP2456]